MAGPDAQRVAGRALGARRTWPAVSVLILTYLGSAVRRLGPFALFGVLLAGGYVWIAERFLARENICRFLASARHRRICSGRHLRAWFCARRLPVTRLHDSCLRPDGARYRLVLDAAGHNLLRPAVAAIGFVVLGGSPGSGDHGSRRRRFPIFNWLLLGYGVPAAACRMAGRLLETRQIDLAQRLADALAVIFTALLLFFQIRHAVTGGDPCRGVEPRRAGTARADGLADVLCLDAARPRAGKPCVPLGLDHPRVRSPLLSPPSAAGLREPWVNSNEHIAGVAIFSSLLVAYLLPGLAAAFLARHARGVRPSWYVTGLYVLAGILVFFYVTLEVRHIFQGDRIGLFRSTSGAEHWAYSVGWLTLGIIYLAYGIWRGAGVARLASAILVLLAVIKVFVFDLAGLTGLWRALSFITLGGVLIGIGLAYQKLVFAHRRHRRRAR